MNKNLILKIAVGTALGIAIFCVAFTVTFLYLANLETIEEVALETRATQTSTRPTKTNPPALASTKQPARTPKPTPTPSLGSIKNPVPFGETVLITTQYGEVFSISLLDAVRGQGAWDAVYESNPFNDPPKAGMEYIVFDVFVEYVKGKESYTFSEYDFAVLSSQRVIDFMYGACCWDGIELFEGGSGEITFALQVYEADQSPLLIYQPFFSKKIFFEIKD